MGHIEFFGINKIADLSMTARITVNVRFFNWLENTMKKRKLLTINKLTQK